MSYDLHKWTHLGSGANEDGLTIFFTLIVLFHAVPPLYAS